MLGDKVIIDFHMDPSLTPFNCLPFMMLKRYDLNFIVCNIKYSSFNIFLIEKYIHIFYFFQNHFPAKYHLSY
jgi:hypothetical protein